MKLTKLFCLIVAVFYVTSNLAQVPRLIEHGALPPNAPYVANFAGFEDVEFAQGDINEDGYQDLIICGSTDVGVRETHIYLQDKDGNYWKSTSNNLTQVTFGTLHLEDLNGDSSLDLLLCGQSSATTYVSELYLNDGKGNFIKQTGTPFIGIIGGRIQVGDIDGDFIPDMIMSGRTKQGDIIRWYKNDGNASFTYDSSSTFSGLIYGSINLADLDGDGDNDLLATGYAGWNSMKVYLNDGMGTFSDMLQIFPEVNSRQAIVSDFDFDGDQDFLISGRMPAYSKNFISARTLFFLNDGNANFTSYIDSVIFPIGGHIAYQEFTGDTLSDLLLIGRDTAGNNLAYIFEGKNTLGFNHYDTLGIRWLINANLGVFHMDGDSLLDLLYIGYGESKYYLNRGTPARIDFELVRNSPFQTVGHSGSAIHDFNGDQFEDVVISEVSGPTLFYMNDGKGDVYLDTGRTLAFGSNGALFFENLDGDSALELVMKSLSYIPVNVSVYDQNVANQYIRSDSFDDLGLAFVNVGDLNGDGAADVLVQGNVNNVGQCRFYKNSGSGTFSLDTTVVLAGLTNATSAFGDIDNDQDLDILLCGRDGIPVTYLYLNNGDGTFQLDTNHQISDFEYARMQFLDLDQDGDQDLFIAGTIRLGYAQYDYFSKLYFNDGSGQFTEKTGHGIRGLNHAGFTFFDLNYDGNLDLYITGYGNYSAMVLYSELYVNDGNFKFNKISLQKFPTIPVNISVCDLEKDGKIELVVCGNGLNRLYTVLNCSTQHTTDSIYSCGPYKWINNVEYTSSNYSDSLILLNQEGCDSIIHLKLTIAYPDTSYLNESVCDSFLWLDGQKYYTDTILSYTRLSSAACDSLVILDLEANHPSSSYFSEVICDSFLWLDSHYYYSDTLLLYTLTNASGCDSIVSMNIDRHDVETRVTQTTSTITAYDSSSSYQWLDCNLNYSVIHNAGNRTFQPTVNGVYAVQIDDGVCIDTSNCIPFTSLGTDNREPATLVFYPNPVRNELTLILPNLSGELELHDMNGKLVLQQAFNENMNLLILNLKGFASGPYVLHLVTRDTSQFQIIIKE